MIATDIKIVLSWSIDGNQSRQTVSNFSGSKLAKKLRTSNILEFQAWYIQNYKTGGRPADLWTNQTV